MEQTFFPVTRREAERLGVPYSSEANKKALFPSQLRELRKEKGVSQDTLSKALGVSKSTVGLWETGDTLPDAKSLCDLSNYFGVSADYLVGKTRVKSTDLSLRSACDYTGLSEKVVKLLEQSKTFRFENLALTLFENFYCEEFLDLFLPAMQYSAYYWLQADLSKAKQSEQERCEEIFQPCFELADVLLGSNDISMTAKIPASIAGDFYCEQAIKMIGEIVSETIKNYKEHLRASAEEIQNFPADIREKLYETQTKIFSILNDSVNGSEDNLSCVAMLNDLMKKIGM